jgi:uncharacterized protein
MRPNKALSPDRQSFHLHGAMNAEWRQRFQLALECGALFFGVPAAVAVGRPRVNVIAVLLVAAAGCWLALNQRYDIRVRDRWHGNSRNIGWSKMLLIYFVAIAALIGALVLFRPEALFALIHNHLRIWVLVMFAYPLLSVFPQELIYRAFFFERYRPLFGSGGAMVFASATVFSFAHIVFHNWPAVVLTFIGGWLFARTYQRTASLLAVCIEHTLYGCAIFTVGYGEFFFEGTLKLFR